MARRNGLRSPILFGEKDKKNTLLGSSLLDAFTKDTANLDVLRPYTKKAKETLREEDIVDLRKETYLEPGDLEVTKAEIEAKIERLRRELAEAEDERDTLNKALDILAQRRPCKPVVSKKERVAQDSQPFKRQASKYRIPDSDDFQERRQYLYNRLVEEHATIIEVGKIWEFPDRA